MNAVAEPELVGRMARSLVIKRKRALGLNAPEATGVVARELRCSPGTITDLIKRRVKRVDGWLRDRIEAALLREVRAEIERLKDEEEAILMGHRRGASVNDLAEIEADLASLKLVIAGRQPA